MPGAPDPLHVRARTALLDATDALVERRTFTAKPPTTNHLGLVGKRASAATNDRMRPARSLTRTTRSPGTHDPFGLPLVKGFKTTGAVLSDIKSDHYVIGHRPLLPCCLRVVYTPKTRKSDW